MQAMGRMNAQMNIASIQQIMMEFEKQVLRLLSLSA